MVPPHAPSSMTAPGQPPVRSRVQPREPTAAHSRQLYTQWNGGRPGIAHEEEKMGAGAGPAKRAWRSCIPRSGIETGRRTLITTRPAPCARERSTRDSGNSGRLRKSCGTGGGRAFLQPGGDDAPAAGPSRPYPAQDQRGGIDQRRERRRMARTLHLPLCREADGPRQCVRRA